MVADLWQKKDKIIGCFKNGTPVVLKQCQNKVNFQRKDSGIEAKFSLNFLRSRKCSVMNKHPFKDLAKYLIRC